MKAFTVTVLATSLMGIAPAAFSCQTFIWTRSAAVLSNGQVMALPRASSSQDGLFRARRCRGDVLRVDFYSQPTAYCLDREYAPIVCNM